jgi:dihydrofolate reductase
VSASLVVAVGRDGAIGRAGETPWYAPEDLAHFKQLTMGHAVVIGSATWASIGRALAGRTLVVVSRRPLDLPDGVRAASSPDEALDLALDLDDEPVIGGGGLIYAALLPRTTRAHVTDVDVAIDGADTFFAPLDPDDWVETESRTGDDPRLTFRLYERLDGLALPERQRRQPADSRGSVQRAPADYRRRK